ncbi:MAG: DNA polymerase III subunit alpha [Anaerolineae bacterium]|nr:DNA polymerase III subunit alpha [Anaerolineae bacterium]
MADFVHLHVHSEYSLLDGLAHIPDLVDRASALGMPALALTDHGAMYGAIEFYRTAQSRGIKPIIGLEIYLTPLGRRMHDREANIDDKRFHLLLLAQNNTGYQNLLKIASAAQLEGFYYRPRIDREFLVEHSAGLIATTSCAAGEIPRLLMQGQEEKARERLEWWVEVFGRERFLIELQEHNIPELSAANRQLVRWARELGLRLIATNDVHYVKQSDAHYHDVLLCVQTGELLKQPNRMRMSDDSYYMKSAAEMAAIFGELPESLTNTLAVAEMCELDLTPQGYHLPRFQVPEGHDAASFLRHLVEEGLVRRYSERADAPEIQARKEHELRIIHDMGFDTYFLIVWDLCEFARRHNIWWNVRGSGAGSLVAYAIGITNLDPLAHNLLFERFLNPGRVSMPDIDLDFPDDQRDQLIDYVVAKYGQENVAQIITFGTLGARASIRDVGRAMDIPLPEVDRIARLIPGGPKVKISDALEFSPELRALYESTDYIRELIDTAMHLEGLARHASTHAAGVIISDRPLVEYTPLHRPTKEGETGIVTQYDMEVLKSIGLLKIDFLGLSTLTVMRRACELIQARHGVQLDLNTIPVEDPKAFELLSSGHVTGIFQVESAGMRRVLTTMKPTKFEHIVATISLYRPGPMEYIDDYIDRMHGRKPVEYHHPALEPILAETYGIIVYQEQIMQIASQLSGYTPGEADLMRRAVGKKKEEELRQHREKFIRGAVERGIPEDAAGRIFDDIEYFANYGFNKAHAADYAVITCQTAYLKAHYPVEYMTALLTVERHNVAKVGALISECRAMGIQVLPPDINASDTLFTIEDTPAGPAIRFGLGAIKNVGEGAVEIILRERARGGPFTSIDDFCRRVDLRQVNRRALESLIRVGALRAFGQRAQLLAIVDRMMSLSAQTHQDAAVGQLSMFDWGGFSAPNTGSILYPLPEVEEVSRREILDWERELVGVYVSEHPMQPVMNRLRDAVTCFLGEIDESLVGHKVTVVGMVSRVRQIYAKNNKTMAFAELEDAQGSIEVVVFSKLYEQTRALWQEGKVVLVRGTVDNRDGQGLKLICEAVDEAITQIRPLAASSESDSPSVPAVVAAGSATPCRLQITIPRTDDAERDRQRVRQVFEIVTSFTGQDHFSFCIQDGAGVVQYDFPEHRTCNCVELQQKLIDLLGATAVRVLPPLEEEGR